MSRAKNNLRALVDELYARSANRIVPPVTFAQVQAALGVATSAIGVNGQRIVDLGTPVNATDAATKQYVDAFSAGLSLKASVVALSSTPIALTGAQTIDGVSIVAGNRVLRRPSPCRRMSMCWWLVREGRPTLQQSPTAST